MRFKYNIRYAKVLDVTIYFDTEEEFENVKQFLTITTKVSYYNHRAKEVRWKNQDVILAVDVDDKGKKSIKVKYGMSKVIRKWLDYWDYKYSVFGEIKREPIKIIDKWIEIFKNHPKKHYGRNQLSTAKAIESNDYGIISLGVGAGKSELILSTAESYLEQNDGNVIIISYSKKVIDEITLRAEKYNVQDERLKIIQPNGFMRRKEASSKEFKDFCEDTDLIIADEAHHFTAQSWKDLFNLVNPIYMYAFTGSADADDGLELNWSMFYAKKTKLQSAELMSYCGEMIIHKELEVPIKVYRSYHKLTNRDDYDQFKIDNPTSLGQATKFTLQNEKLPTILANAINEYIPKDSLVFIPELTSIETGVFLSDGLNKLGIPTVYYSAKYVNSPIGRINLSLKDLKELAKERQFKVLISNTVGVEGIDIPNLSSIIPLTGVKFKSVIQPIGRSARSDLVHCIFIFDNNNPMYNRQNLKRYLTVKKKLNVISDEEIQIQE